MIQVLSTLPPRWRCVTLFCPRSWRLMPRSLSLLVCNFRTISLYAWVFSQCTSLIKPDYRSGTAHCVGHLEPTLRVDCTTFVSGCLLNIHFDRQVSCYLLPTADSN